jgi:hypothetical protein
MNTYPGMNQSQNPRQTQQAGQPQPAHEPTIDVSNPMNPAPEGTNRPVNSPSNAPVTRETQRIDEITKAVHYDLMRDELLRAGGRYLEFQRINDKDSFSQLLSENLSEYFSTLIQRQDSQSIGPNLTPQSTHDRSLLVTLSNMASSAPNADELITDMDQILDTELQANADPDQLGVSGATMHLIKAAVANSIQECYTNIDSTSIKDSSDYLNSLDQGDQDTINNLLARLGIENFRNIQSQDLLDVIAQSVFLCGVDNNDGLEAMVSYILADTPSLNREQTQAAATQTRTELSLVNSLKRESALLATQLTAKETQLSDSQAELNTLIADLTQPTTSSEMLELTKTQEQAKKTAAEATLQTLETQLQELNTTGKKELELLKEQLQEMTIENRQNALTLVDPNLATTKRQALEAQQAALFIKIKDLDEKIQEITDARSDELYRLNTGIGVYKHSIESSESSIDQLDQEILEAKKLEADSQEIVDKRKEVDVLKDEFAKITADLDAKQTEFVDRIHEYNQQHASALKEDDFEESDNVLNAKEFNALLEAQLNAAPERVNLTEMQATLQLQASLTRVQNPDLAGGLSRAVLDKVAAAQIATRRISNAFLDYRTAARSTDTFTAEQLEQDQAAQEQLADYYPLDIHEAVVGLAEGLYAQGGSKDVSLKSNIERLASTADPSKMESIFASIQNSQTLLMIAAELNSFRDGTRFNTLHNQYMIYKTTADAAAASRISDAIVNYVQRLKTQELTADFNAQVPNGNRLDRLAALDTIMTNRLPILSKTVADAYAGSRKPAAYRLIAGAQADMQRLKKEIFGFKSPLSLDRKFARGPQAYSKLRKAVDKAGLGSLLNLGGFLSTRAKLRSVSQTVLGDTLSSPLWAARKYGRATTDVGVTCLSHLWQVPVKGYQVSRSAFTGTVSATKSVFKGVLATPGFVLGTVASVPIHIVRGFMSPFRKA